MRTLWTVGLAAVILVSGCAEKEQADSPEPAAQTAPEVQAEATVLAAVQGNPEFSTFVQAIIAADLAATLNGSGPFTVFAPTNAAFEKLPAARREALMRPERRQDLQALLTHHVVPGRLAGPDIISRVAEDDGQVVLTTVQGGALTVREDDGRWVVSDENGNTAAVAMPDVAASNGVVHAIDSVLTN